MLHLSEREYNDLTISINKSMQRNAGNEYLKKATKEQLVTAKRQEKRFVTVAALLVTV